MDAVEQYLGPVGLTLPEVRIGEAVANLVVFDAHASKARLKRSGFLKGLRLEEETETLAQLLRTIGRDAVHIQRLVPRAGPSVGLGRLDGVDNVRLCRNLELPRALSGFVEFKRQCRVGDPDSEVIREAEHPGLQQVVRILEGSRCAESKRQISGLVCRAVWMFHATERRIHCILEQIHVHGQINVCTHQGPCVRKP